MSKKEAILDAGIKLFAEKGFNGTSMAELAELTGIAGATIFYHFKNKEELFLAVLEKIAGDILKSFNDYFKENAFSTGTGIEMVEGAISFFLLMAGRCEEWFLLLQRNHPYQLAETNIACRGHLETIYNCFIDIFERAIRIGKNDGTVRDVPAHKTALMLFATVDGVVRLQTYQLYNAGALYNTLINLCRSMLENRDNSYGK